MDEARANGIRKARLSSSIIPCLLRSGLGPIPAPDNPHKVIASYAKDMEVVVFNGHVHTTEIYDVDGVKYLMLGRWQGAEQDPILPGRTSIWRCPLTIRRTFTGRASLRKEEATTTCWWTLNPAKKTKFYPRSRFRPWSAEPFRD